MIRRDWTGRSPLSYRLRLREREEVRAVVLHQTGFEWDEDSRMWAKVRAHAVVHRSGLVTDLHPLLVRMLYGCGVFNVHAFNVELEGNHPLDYRDGEPVYWRPDVYGRSVLGVAQVEAARELLADLAARIPGLQVGAHRQLEMDRSGCCGPDLWRAVGQHAVDVLGMPEMPTHGGRPIPDEWRGPPAPSLRLYDGPLGVSP